MQFVSAFVFAKDPQHVIHVKSPTLCSKLISRRRTQPWVRQCSQNGHVPHLVRSFFRSFAAKNFSFTHCQSKMQDVNTSVNIIVVSMMKTNQVSCRSLSLSVRPLAPTSVDHNNNATYVLYASSTLNLVHATGHRLETKHLRVKALRADTLNLEQIVTQSLLMSEVTRCKVTDSTATTSIQPSFSCIAVHSDAL